MSPAGFLKAAAGMILSVPIATSGAQSAADPLTGLSEVTVGIMMGGNPAYDLPAGVSVDRLRAVIESRLRNAGLRVLTEDEDRQSSDFNASLRLGIVVLPLRTVAGTNAGWAWSSDVQVRQLVRIPDWTPMARVLLYESRQSLAYIGTEDVAAVVEKIVGDRLDEFIRAWRKANPRPS